VKKYSYSEFMGLQPTWRRPCIMTVFLAPFASSVTESPMNRSHDSGSGDTSSEPGRPGDQQPAGSASRRARSGDFSHDPTLDPDQLFQVIGREESVERVSDAMRAFLASGDMATFERAVAVFIRSARARGEPVERVLAVLVELVEEREGVAYPHDWTPTDLRRLVLRAVLLAFYGETPATPHAPSVERRHSGERRRADIQPPTDEREGPR
jgi:hypothetical protein